MSAVLYALECILTTNPPSRHSLVLSIKVRPFSVSSEALVVPELPDGEYLRGVTNATSLALSVPPVLEGQGDAGQPDTHEDDDEHTTWDTGRRGLVRQM